jgi:hypothetical protein
MYMAAAAMEGGVSFPASWNLAFYLFCRAAKIFGLRFWPVVTANMVFYAGIAAALPAARRLCK